MYEGAGRAGVPKQLAMGFRSWEFRGLGGLLPLPERVVKEGSAILSTVRFALPRSAEENM